MGVYGKYCAILWHVAVFAAAWLSLAISHSFWSALVLLVPAIAMAPTIASRPSDRVRTPTVSAPA